MTREVDWGDIPDKKKLSPKRQVDWGDEEQLAALKKQHPLMYKLAEQLQGSPALEKAGNIAGHFNNAVEGTGLPSAAKGFLGTGIEMGRGLTNLIPGVNIKKQEYPQLNVNPYVGETAEIGGSFGMGLPVYRGYQAAKKGIEALPYAKKIPEIIRNVLAGGAVGSAISPDHRRLGAALGAGAELAPKLIEGIIKGINRYRTAPKQRALEQAERNLLASEGENETLKNEASHRFKQSNPERLLMTAADKSRELEQGLGFQRAHETPEMAMMRPGEQGVSESEGSLQNINNQLRQALGEGEPHTQKLSQDIVNEIEGVPVIEPHPKTGLPRMVRKGGLREEVGQKYDRLEENLPEIEIPKSVDTNAIEKEMKELIGKKSDVSEAEKENLRKLLIKSHPGTKTKTINGKEFFRTYRSLMREEGNQRSKAFSGLSPKDHDEWIARANNTKKIYEDMENIINKHFPKDTLKKLYEINHEYSTKVAPLHENPMYQQMLNHGSYKGDYIENLAGTTKGSDILRRMIQTNPERSRLALGHNFAEKPENLLKPNQLVEPYQRANPEIARLMQLQRQGHEATEKARSQEPIVQQIIKNRELRHEIDSMKKHANKLKNSIEEKNISEEEVQRRKEELRKVTDRINKIKHRASRWGQKAAWSGATAIGAYLGTKAANK